MGIPNWRWKDWCVDSLRWRGTVLNGKFAHWCYEWDGLPVDETTDEFSVCLCFRCDGKDCPDPDQCTKDQAEIAAHQDRLRAERAAFEASSCAGQAESG